MPPPSALNPVREVSLQRLERGGRLISPLDLARSDESLSNAPINRSARTSPPSASPSGPASPLSSKRHRITFESTSRECQRGREGCIRRVQQERQRWSEIQRSALEIIAEFEGVDEDWIRWTGRSCTLPHHHRIRSIYKTVYSTLLRQSNARSAIRL